MFSKLIITLMSIVFSNQALAIPVRILIIRHGEKPTDKRDKHLSERGFQRAKAMTKLFLQQPDLIKFGKPIAIFAYNNLVNGSFRGIETATPLADSLGFAVNSFFRPDQYNILSKFIFESSAYNQKMIMIVWRHLNIRDLATALGVLNPPAWDGQAFDRIWQIDYNVQGGVASFKDLPQHLLPGDSN